MNLKEFCRAKGISQEKLADLVGVSPTHICLIIKGKRTPSIHLISKIESVTKGAVKLADLLHPLAPSRLKNKKKNTSE